jgi:hypothetical protein
MKSGEGAWTKEWEAVARRRAARGVGAFACAPRSTRLGSAAGWGVGGIFSSRTAFKLQNPCEISGWAPVYGLRGGSIRKKVIGHGMPAVVAGLAFRKQVGTPRRPVALLQEQASQHGGGVFVDPLVNEGRDLLSEIGGMRQTRQFKALKRVPRSREQELPGWLGRAGGHRPPMGTQRTVTDR